MGHPEIITQDFKNIEEYFGIVKCIVVPPRGLFLPVLPYRCNKKLMFPLCRLCAETSRQDSCDYSEDQRQLTGTWVTEELKLAIKKGYIVKEVNIN